MRKIGRVDIKGSRCIKGISMEGQFVVDDADKVIGAFNRICDEVFICDTVASHFGTTTLDKVLPTISEYTDKPLIVGGGIKTVEYAEKLFKLGADKIAINSQLFKDTGLLTKLINRFGAQSIILSIQALYRDGQYYAAYDYGREMTSFTLQQWIDRINSEGVFPGECLVTSVERDGTMLGVDEELIKLSRSIVDVPFIYSGGYRGERSDSQYLKEVDAIAISKYLHVGTKKYEPPRKIEHRDAIQESVNIHIIDTGCGNIYSLKKCLIICGFRVTVVKDLPRQEIKSNTVVCIPGVGNFGRLCEQFDRDKVRSDLKEWIENGGACIGICLGMQVMYTQSDESPGDMGLSLIDEVLHMLTPCKESMLRVPRIGYANIRIREGSLSRVLKRHEDEEFYFVHSYADTKAHPKYTAAVTDFGKSEYAVIIHYKNTVGFQFHPELSGECGRQLLIDVIRSLLNIH